jgi:thiosulfate/3-mercaptopyruvate sulfurtransferase
MVDGEAFAQTVHGQISCVECHGGTITGEKDSAHSEIIANPSEDGQAVCGNCHPDVTATAPQSLHVTQKGYWTVLDTRSTPESHAALEEMFGNHCSSCHTTCGDCHVSQPNSVGGGFIDGHLFKATPSMTRNCTACHGSRVGKEYLGKHEGLKPDVHFRQGRMTCVSCHTGHEMHGKVGDCESCHTGPEESSIPPPDHRYDGVQSPRCETCHTPVTTGQDGIEMHQVHGGDLSCQVCHSVSYTSCDGCHVAVSESSGRPFFETQGSYLTFLIGRNPIRSFDRPYTFVPVRHIPIDPDSYEYYGDNLLPNFDLLPTWAYATPHNIQLETPQTESCDACHGNPDLFLTLDKVAPEEVEANIPIIVDTVPEPTEGETTLETEGDDAPAESP